MSEVEKQKLIDLLDELEMANELKEKVIDKMAEDMATDYHSKEWVINFYMEKINESIRNNTIQVRKSKNKI